MEIDLNLIERFISYGIFSVYIFCLFIIFIYSLTQLNMLRYFLLYKKNKKTNASHINQLKELPKVTIQLPIYNEIYVIERLIQCISALEYPKEKLQIQVLDDSTDESLSLTKKIILIQQEKGTPIEHVIRNTRTGFKAGALKEGLKSATGDLIAIFDADFLPHPKWLLETVPHFSNPKIGVIQTRWGHLNREYSILTQAQGFALDAHFLLEQIGRNQQNHFINFNGTAGIWRKKCIIDAGNWEGDTLTEDLDLSYRAQLKQWKIYYLDTVVTPAELPITLSAIRSQQFRWNKGGAENFRKMIGRVINSKKISFSTKFNAFFHLLNSSMFLCILIAASLSVPLLFIKERYENLNFLFNLSGLFIVSTLIFFICYWSIHKYLFGGGVNSFIIYIKRFFLFYCLAIGFAFHNTIAVLEGHLGKKSAFIRTPKFNISEQKKGIKNNKYTQKNKSIYTFIELLFALYFLFGMVSAFTVSQKGDFGLFPFHLLLFIGFGSITYYGMKRT
ncbi:glycosyltransferase family 2 protein [Flavobacteriaceae bacterium]|nr:glycosyltransferase family 2 protein [Flavobacteriaceae bacterium]